MQKYKKRIIGLLLALMYVLIYIVINILVQFIYMVFVSSNNSDKSNSEIFSTILSGTYALSVIACIITMWVYIIISKIRKKPINRVINNSKITPALSSMIVCSAIGSRLIVNVYIYISQKIPLLRKSIEQAAETAPEILNSFQLIIAVLLMVIIAPVFEEFLFRGLVMGELLMFMRPWAAIVLQGIIFGIAHAALFQSIFASVLGIMLGVIYYYTKSFKAASIYHITFNASVIFATTELSSVSAVVILILGFALVGISLFYIIVNSNK